MHIPVRHLKDRRTTFYRIEYDVILSFGLTELKAQLAWKENVCIHLSILSFTDLTLLQGVEKRCVACSMCPRNQILNPSLGVRLKSFSTLMSSSTTDHSVPNEDYAWSWYWVPASLSFLYLIPLSLVTLLFDFGLDMAHWPDFISLYFHDSSLKNLKLQNGCNIQQDSDVSNPSLHFKP